MAIGIAGDNPLPTPLNQTTIANANNQDLLDQILTELRTLTYVTQAGLNVIDEPNSFRNDPSNSNPTLQ